MSTTHAVQLRLDRQTGLWVAEVGDVAAQGDSPADALASLGRSLVAQWAIERGRASLSADLCDDLAVWATRHLAGIESVGVADPGSSGMTRG